jgi:hypothetical protein
MIVQNYITISQRLIMMTKIQNEIQFKKNLSAYLLELKSLTGKTVSSESLSSINEVERIRNEASILENYDISRFTIDFKDKSEERFKNFIIALSNSNKSSVYIWTNRSNFCGLYKIPSIKMFDFSFPFDVNPDGLVVFLSEDINDQLLLDFSYDSKGQEVLEVELKGRHWPFIKY